MSENQTENQSPLYVADFSYNFAGAKGAVHMDGDEDSLRTFTIDVSGENPEDAMALRVEFQGNLFLQLAAGAARILDAMGPAFAKAVSKAASDIGSMADDLAGSKGNRAPSDVPDGDAPAQGNDPSEELPPQDETPTAEEPTPEAETEEA